MKKVLLAFLLSFSVTICFSQDPNWSVNPSNYQYSMTFTAFLNVNGTTLSSTNDKVAAFIDNEVRGVANLVYLADEDKYVAYLTVYNSTSNSPVSFKIYNSTANNVVDAVQTINFQIDRNVGSVFQSYSIASTALNNQANITDFSFKNTTVLATSIVADTIEITLPSTVNLNNLVANFTTNTGAKVYVDFVLQNSGVSSQNFSNPIKFQVLSEDESVLKNYDIVIIKDQNIQELAVSLTTARTQVVENPTEIQVTFNQPIVALEKENFVLSNAIIQNISKVDNLNYKLNIVAIQQGDFSIEIPENSIKTSNNTTNQTSSKIDFLFDANAPFLISITRKSPLATLTNANSVAFLITFNEPVKNIFATDFNSIAGAVISLAKISDTNYTATITNIENTNGTIGLSLKADNAITDLVGNPLRTTVTNHN
ncbi:hypothetical protein [Polaribacter sp. Hel_I_88]|uniref:hypothetical protein n=1 Tax=Polaribacter sp. Hel_I_88 TaxID=1250006 RepID=UPI00047C4244|nr:hypothetical protein [Polaribacter sp. Hel_I_88]